MFGFFKSKRQAQLVPECSKTYNEQKAAMHSDNVEDRMVLATDQTTSKEILYYLAEKDPSPAVRLAVTRNPAMPVQASPVLAQDSNVDVRIALAKRLVELLPGLSQDKHSQLYAFAVDSLGTLALDEVLKIRVALSTTLKDHAHTPPKIAGQLARDLEREVSEPILRFCASLSDQDLLEILCKDSPGWIIEAIANRDNVSAEISQAVIDVENEPGGTALILNDSADVSETLLLQIVDKSKEITAWQKPTATRKNLPIAVAREMARFVDASIRDILTSRDDFDYDMIEEISSVFQRRLDFMSNEDGDEHSAEDRVRALFNSGDLNEQVISDAMAARDREFLNHAVAKLAKIRPSQADQILSMQAPKPIVALCWRADLSMRLAFQVQKEIGHIQPKELIYPKDGSDYPLSEEDLEWQLEFLDIKS
jgi:uncharacterized protein (DUF2336 family)